MAQRLGKYQALIIPMICLGLIISGMILKGSTLAAFSVPCYIAAFVIGGFKQGVSGITTLVKEHDLDVDLLMVVAAFGAGMIGYWNDGALLIFIFSLSGALEEMTSEKTHQDIEKMMTLKPQQAVRLTETGEEEVAVQTLAIGDEIRVLPGEKIPADGVIKKGYSSVDQAMITGESIPVDVTLASSVFAGTINLTGAIHVQVTKLAEETMLSQIIKMVEEAQSEMPPNQLFVEKFERIYARIVILVALGMMIFWPLLTGSSFSDGVYKAMVFLVVASPCALVASIMPAMLAAISKGARQGILYKGGVHVEHAGGIDTVVFDKTGTLTEGRMRVTDVLAFDSFTKEKVLSIAASVEALSDHPIARSITAYAKEQNIPFDAAEEGQTVSGSGVSASLSNKRYFVGKVQEEVLENFTAEIHVQIKDLESGGKTVIACQDQHQLLGLIALEDTIRKDALQAVSALNTLGIETILLTGDNEVTAQAIGRKLGISQITANLLPGGKAAYIAKLKADGKKVAMVGDGVNDAPALATSDLGIAMGLQGTDVALETANVVLLSDELNCVPATFATGRKANRIVKQNISFAIGVMIVLVVSNFLFSVQLPLGVVGHEGSTLLVILNGMRLLK